MHAPSLLAFIALDTVLCIVPGPAVMAVVGSALARKVAGIATATGILTGNAIYFATSAFGILTILVASHGAFIALKWAGAAYLAYLGIRTVASPHGSSRLPSRTSEASGSFASSWLGGTLTQLSNPKALVFFSAIVPQFVDPRAPLLPQAVVLGVASLAIEAAVLSAYIAGVETIRERGIKPSSRALAERVGGVFLIGVAAAVLVERT